MKFWQTRQQGSSLAWTAAFLAMLLVPLMILIGDGARLYYVRGRLTSAAEAECEYAAQWKLSRPAWQRYKTLDWDRPEGLVSCDGPYCPKPTPPPTSYTPQVFYSVLAERNKVPFTASISVSFGSERVSCAATARVPLTFGGNATIQTTAVSRVRYYVRP